MFDHIIINNKQNLFLNDKASLWQKDITHPEVIFSTHLSDKE